MHKIFSSLKAFQQEKQKLLASETLKDRKYYLYLFYKHFCSENEKTLVTGENILEKFMETIHEKDETRFIENLLETPFSRFGMSLQHIVQCNISINVINRQYDQYRCAKSFREAERLLCE